MVADRLPPQKKSNGCPLPSVHYSVSSACGARTADSKFPLWEASQNGMFLLMPQRHSENAGFVSYLLPAPSNSSTSPEILKDPLSFTLIVTFDKKSTPFKLAELSLIVKVKQENCKPFSQKGSETKKSRLYGKIKHQERKCNHETENHRDSIK